MDNWVKRCIQGGCSSQRPPSTNSLLNFTSRVTLKNDKCHFIPIFFFNQAGRLLRALISFLLPKTIFAHFTNDMHAMHKKIIKIM